MSFHLPPPARHWSGPPESPWHESFPPAAYPAQIIVGWWNVLPYQSGRPQMSSGIRRTTTSRSLEALVYPTVMVTSVTETIQKALLAEAQTAFYENKKMRSVERGYLSYNRNSVKKLLPYAKHHWNWAISCWVMARDNGRLDRCQGQGDHPARLPYTLSGVYMGLLYLFNLVCVTHCLSPIIIRFIKRLKGNSTLT